jgi:7,8-dihydropterin-6-yl-methyl-4-(beta-D-ribofuranosyl)aminobenzene 5'-phosphate synthase
MKIDILTNNTVRKRNLLAEHGLSIRIEHQGFRILFDTGQSDVYCKNAARMGLDLKSTDAIVLSHGHYDHCGGLPSFPSAALPEIYVHPAAFQPRFFGGHNEKSLREIGIPWTLADHPMIQDKVIPVQKPTQIKLGITLCPQIPYTTDFEPIPDGFYREEKGKRCRDSFQDEQILVIEDDGLFVFLGCSHPGVANCLHYIATLFPQQHINLVIGGMHLMNADCQRTQMTIQYLKKLNITKIVPLHCTGFPAMAEMKRQLGDQCLLLNAGDSLEF